MYPLVEVMTCSDVVPIPVNKEYSIEYSLNTVDLELETQYTRT